MFASGFEFNCLTTAYTFCCLISPMIKRLTRHLVINHLSPNITRTTVANRKALWSSTHFIDTIKAAKALPPDQGDFKQRRSYSATLSEQTKSHHGLDGRKYRRRQDANR